MTNPTSPGWYEDPETPGQLRYFDGILWTGHTTPRAGIHAPAEVADQVVAPQAPSATQAPVAPGHGGAPGPAVGSDAPLPPSNPYQGPPAGQAQHPGPGQHPSASRVPAASAADGTLIASYGRRVGAFVLDGLIKMVLNLVLGGWAAYLAVRPELDRAMDAARAGKPVPLDLTGQNADLRWMAVYLVITGVIGLAYSVFFLTRRGATPGKSALGISVRHIDRPGPLDIHSATVRYAIPFATAVLAVVPAVGTLMSLVWIADSLAPLTQPRRQALHDHLAHTIVVVGPQPPRRPGQPGA